MAGSARDLKRLPPVPPRAMHVAAMNFFQSLGTPNQAVPASEARTLALAGREVPLHVRSNPRAKRLTLRIEPGGHSLQLTVPPRTRKRDVEAFIERHRDWAAGKLERLPPAPRVEVGAHVPVADVPHRVVHSGTLRGATRIGDGGEPRIVVSGPEDRAGARVADFLKRRARAEIEPLVARYAVEVGRQPRAVQLKDTRSRWGSCTSEGTLSFSWRMAMAPPDVLDALVAHEVAHLIHMNHGDAFWALARDLCPGTDEARAWLRLNGSGLHAYRFHA